MAATPLLRDRLSFLHRLPVLLKGTSDDDAPCPGYLFEEIASILPVSPRRALGFCPQRPGPSQEPRRPRCPMLPKRGPGWVPAGRDPTRFGDSEAPISSLLP